MSKSNTHPCPVCSTPTPHQERYPLSVYSNCFNRASDRTGKKLKFFNINMSGGYQAIVEETGERYQSHTCYINEIECHADEARFGGIVIEAAK